MHFIRAGARLNIPVRVTRTRTNNRRDSNVMGFHDVQTFPSRFYFAHNPRALLWSTLNGNGRSRTYEKSLSVRRTPARRVSFRRELPGFYGSHLRVGRDRECQVNWHVFTPRNNCRDRLRGEIIDVMCCSKSEVALED